MSLIATFTLELSLWCWDGDRQAPPDIPLFLWDGCWQHFWRCFYCESYEGTLFAEEEIDVFGNWRLLGLGQGLTQSVITVTSAW